MPDILNIGSKKIIAYTINNVLDEIRDLIGDDCYNFLNKEIDNIIEDNEYLEEENRELKYHLSLLEEESQE